MTLITRLQFLTAATLGAYVVINVLLFALSPVTRGLPQLGMTAILVPPMVLAMVFLVIPVARRVTQNGNTTESTRAQA